MRVVKPIEGVDRTPSHLSNIPSWTWLSCPCAIEYNFWKSRRGEDEGHLDIYDHVKLIDWVVVWTSEPLTSTVKSTRLILNGPVREIVLSVAPRGKDHNPPYLDAANEKPEFGKRPFPWKYAVSSTMDSE